MSNHKLPEDCTCGHTWEDHHHGCIMNPKFPTEDHKRGICGGLMAQECEFTRVNGQWLFWAEKDRCYCERWEGIKMKAFVVHYEVTVEHEATVMVETEREARKKVKEVIGEPIKIRNVYQISDNGEQK